MVQFRRAGHLQQIKAMVADVLTPHASAILLDPEYGLTAAQERHGKGLFLAYEKTGYDATTPGRLPDLLDHWSVYVPAEGGRGRLREGIDVLGNVYFYRSQLTIRSFRELKVGQWGFWKESLPLPYYTPFDDASVYEQKSVWAERVGAECRALDIAFFLELVGYDTEGGGEHSLSYARRKPEIVRNSAIEFSKARYAVDVLKVEIPVALDYVEGTRSFRGVKAYDRSEALQHFREAAAGTSLPFIYLSAGVSNSVFVESSCVVAQPGRTALPLMPSRAPKHLRNDCWVEEVQNIERVNVNAMLKAATPWSKRLNSPHN